MLRIVGPLRVDVFHASVAELVQRHESLRTQIRLDSGTPKQFVNIDQGAASETVDLSHRSLAHAEAESLRIIREVREQTIDLSSSALFDVKLLRLSETIHIVIMLFDHIVSDATSWEIANREIWTAYRQLTRGMPTSLPPLPVQFGDYAAWQQLTWAHWESRHANYWRSHLSHSSETIIPIDDRLASTCEPTGSVKHFAFGRKLSYELRQLSDREQIPFGLVVLALYVMSISRWCEDNHLLLHTVSHGRHGRPELQNMIGWLSHPIYLQIDLPNPENFRESLEQVRAEFKATSERVDCDRLFGLFPMEPPELTFNWMSLRRMRKSAASESDDQLSIRQINLTPLVYPKFAPLFYDTEAGLLLNVYFRHDLIAATTVERFGNDLSSLATKLVRDLSA